MEAAFFDVDTQWGDRASQCLLLRVHLKDMAPVYDRMAEIIQARAARVVATLCVQSPVIDLTTHPDLVWVPMEDSHPDWRDRVESGNRFVLEKRTCGSPEANREARAFDVFFAHPYASDLIRRIGIRKWYVFGRAEMCVGAVVNGLLALGLDVTVVSDAVAPGSKGNAETVQEFLRTCGTDLITVEELAALQPA